MTQVLRPVFTEASEKRGANPALRPRDAATLVLIDRAQGPPRLLMGRRKASLAFMPGLYVFPGGRVDPWDPSMPHLGSLSVAAIARLGRRARISPKRMRALALAAIRETAEETGVLVGQREDPGSVPEAWAPFARHGVTPDLSALVFAVRAITPPGRPRRFDTRFFLAEASAIGGRIPASEFAETDLEAVEWLTVEEARTRPLPYITTMILGDLAERLALPDWADQTLPIPFYTSRGRDQVKETL
jgi:8-oxo-dGTP pyrophosphatase MutT (NUDIX family)